MHYQKPENKALSANKHRSALPILLPIFSIALAGLIAMWYLAPPAPPSSPTNPEDTVKGMMNTPYISKGINNPLILKLNEIDLADDTPVIGVEHKGRFRAYKLEALKYVNTHVVNDMLDKTPISVTYCDRMDCVSVYTDPQSDKALPIDVGGFRERMFLKVGDGFYFQDDGASISDNVAGKMPYPKHEFVRTTWKEWKTAHPTTDVFAGGIKRS